MRIGLVLAAAIAFMAAAPAHAAKLLFEITGSGVASFEMDSRPTVLTSADGTFFTVSDVAGSFLGRSTPLASLVFFSSADGGSGGLQIIDPVDNNSVLLDVGGDQLFGNSLASPVFSAGTFALTSFTGTSRYSLTISSADAVPEPATWVVMIAGFALVGGALRRQRRFAAVSARIAA